MRKGRSGLVALAAVLAAASGGWAAESAPGRLAGQIASVEGRQVTVRTPEGSTVPLELTQDARVLGMAPASPEALAEGATIGAAAVEQPGGRLKALLVVLYPEDLQGSGEGYFTWNLAPDSTMVQGEVRSVENGPEGRVLSIYYPQAGATLVVPPEAEIVALEPGGPDLLRQDAHLFVPNAERAAGGDALTASVVAVGKDGFVPPM